MVKDIYLTISVNRLLIFHMIFQIVSINKPVEF
jgi:hypothetical protein